MYMDQPIIANAVSTILSVLKFRTDRSILHVRFVTTRSSMRNLEEGLVHLSLNPLAISYDRKEELERGPLSETHFHK